MIVQVDGVDAHAATGGGRADRRRSGRRSCIHGAGMDSHGVAAADAVPRPPRPACSRRSTSRLTAAATAKPIESIVEMADWVVRFLDAAGFDRAHVVGHSMGTFIALELAARYPNRIDVDHAVRHGHRDARPSRAPRRGRARPAPRRGADGSVGPRQAGPCRPQPDAGSVDDAAVPERWSRTVGRVCWRPTSVRAWRTTGPAPAASEVACPATVVIGRGDKMTPPKSGRALATALPTANVVELDATGHMMMIEHPVGVKRAIRDTVAV